MWLKSRGRGLRSCHDRKKDNRTSISRKSIVQGPYHKVCALELQFLHGRWYLRLLSTECRSNDSCCEKVPKKKVALLSKVLDLRGCGLVRRLHGYFSVVST